MRRDTALAVMAPVLFVAACGRPQYPRVSLAETDSPAPTANPEEPCKLPLRVAIAAVISPQATLDAYRPLLDYLSVKLDRPVELIQRGTYAEINELIRLRLDPPEGRYPARVECRRSLTTPHASGES